MDQGFTLDQLPEGCIANILSLTSPPDACRSSVVCKIFRSAADSNWVWQRFLPSDIGQILSSAVSPPVPDSASKKELFLHLSDNPLLIDNGPRSFSLEKCSGKKCYLIPVKELSALWGDEPAYWVWRTDPESRVPEVAERLDVYWLEFRGRMEARLLSPNTRYGAYLMFQFGGASDGLRLRAGLHAEVSVKLITGVRGHGEVREWKTVRLTPAQIARRDADPRQQGQIPKEREDGRLEIEMGEFFNEGGEDGQVETSLMVVKRLYWKPGFPIEGIELRPKKNQ